MNTEVIVKYHGNLDKIRNDLNAVVELLNANYAIITLAPEKIPNLYNYTEIEFIELPKKLYSVLENELVDVCIPTLQNSDYNLTGKNTIVAIIDSGIDYTHPDFRKEDGSSRILSIWDQTRNGTPPEGFAQGTEYDTVALNAALTRSRNNSIDGHHRSWNSSCRSCMRKPRSRA